MCKEHVRLTGSIDGAVRCRWGFGYISAAALLVFTIMLTCWRDREAEAMDRVALSHSARPASSAHGSAA